MYILLGEVIHRIEAMGGPRWTLDMFSEEFLRFRKEDLRRLYDLLNFPDEVVLDNWSIMTGEEFFERPL